MDRIIAGFGLLLLLPIAAHGDDAANAILEKAIAAHSGKDGKLEKLKSSAVTFKGTMYTPAGEMAASRKVISEWPKKCRSEYGLARGEGEVRVIIVLDGFTAWRKASGMPVVDAVPEEFDMMQADVHSIWVTTLLPLKEKAFTLTVLPESTVDGAPVVGFTAAYRGRPDNQLYFDKKTGLLARVVFQGKEAGKPVTKDRTFGEYKEFGGLLLPTTQIYSVDRRKAESWKNGEYQFVEKLGKEVFAKP